MLRKVIIGVIAAILLVGAGNLWAKQAKEESSKKQEVEKAQKDKEGKGQKRVDLLAELTKAYEQKDMEKIGKVIEQMKQRREEMREARRADGEGMQEIQRDRVADRRHARQFRGMGGSGQRYSEFECEDIGWRCWGCPEMWGCSPRGRGMGGGCPMAWNRGMEPQHQRFGQPGYGRGQWGPHGGSMHRADREFSPQDFGRRNRRYPPVDSPPASEWDW